MSISRRKFLKLSGCSLAAASVANGLTRLGLLNSTVKAATDYKALVCVFLFGGNDGNNLLVPNDTAGYSLYETGRTGLAIPRSSLLPIAPLSGGEYGLHPMLPRLAQLFTGKQAALLLNTGVLAKPVTRAQVTAGTALTPDNLYSHPDQQREWQCATALGPTLSGWGGRLADRLQGLNGPGALPMVISVCGSNVFCNGLATVGVTVKPGTHPGFDGYDGDPSENARYLAMQQMFTFDSGVSMVKFANDVGVQTLNDVQILSSALANLKPFSTQFPTSSMGEQMQQVAQLIQVREALGMTRQIFFVSVQGYDTHSDELDTHTKIYAELDSALYSLFQSTVEMGVDQNVTAFTHSDFGRTFAEASGGGSDHAWGNHQVIVGGAVKGGNVYGTFPNLALGGPDDVGSVGRWIPTTALDQYAATLSAWFGASTTDLNALFPNLRNFGAANLGFL